MTKIFTVISIAFVVVLAMLFLLGPHLSAKQPELTNATLMKSQAAMPMPAFLLKSTQGETFTQKDFKGFWTLIFFGYKDCPDICPATLSVLRETWNKQFGTGAPVKFVFASINPGQDDIEHLKQFVERFHPSFIGVTGQQFEMQKLMHHLGVFAKQQEGLSPAGGPMIDHTSALMLINPQTKLHAIMTPPFEAKILAEDLTTLTKG